GAFVEIEPGIDGLIHISDMSWTKRVQHPSEVLRKGDDVQVVVLGVDPENKRISLGLKQTEEDPWDSLATQYGAGVEKTGTVVRLAEDGVVVDLGDDVEGFIPRSQLEIPEGEVVENYVREGVQIPLRVIEFDGTNRRIVLTPTAPLQRQPGEAPKRAEPAEEEAAAVAEEEESPGRGTRCLLWPLWPWTRPGTHERLRRPQWPQAPKQTSGAASGGRAFARPFF